METHVMFIMGISNFGS